MKTNALVVFHILNDAGCSLESAEPLETSVIATAARMLQGHIHTHGDKFTTAAFNQSSGRIPKRARPFPTPPVDGTETGSEHTVAARTALDDVVGGEPQETSDAVADNVFGPQGTPAGSSVREAFAARKSRGRRFMRTRK